MLYNSEEIFIDKFIACMKLEKLNEFPFDTESFYCGIEKMSQYFQANRGDFGEDADEIALLFIKKPLEGVYARFRDAISGQNGSSVSFENPGYIKGFFKISEKDAEDVLDMEQLSVSNEYIKAMTVAFCEGAGLK